MTARASLSLYLSVSLSHSLNTCICNPPFFLILSHHLVHQTIMLLTSIHSASWLLTCPWARHSAATAAHTLLCQRGPVGIWNLEMIVAHLGGEGTFKTRAFTHGALEESTRQKPEERPVMKWHTLPTCHSTEAAACSLQPPQIPPPPPTLPPSLDVTDNTTRGSASPCVSDGLCNCNSLRRPHGGDISSFRRRHRASVTQTADGDQNRPQWSAVNYCKIKKKKKNHKVAARHHHCSSLILFKKKIYLVTA